jgi:cell division septal protein FtsQ
MPPKKKLKKYPVHAKTLFRRYRWYLKLTTFIVFFSVGGFGLYYLLFLSSYFKVDQLRVTGAGGFVNQTDLTEVVKGRVYGKSIFSFKNEELRASLKQNFQGAKDIKVHKIYPKAIGVEVSERVPLALINNGTSENFYMVDEDGYVLGIVDEQRTILPRIRYEGDIKIGFFVDKRMVPVYLELVNALNQEQVNATSMSFYPRFAKLFLASGTEAFFSNDKNKLDSVRLMTSIIKQLEAEGKKLQKIDLRYEKVSVSYD